MSSNPQTCDHCQRPLAPDVRFCDWCGHSVSSRQMTPGPPPPAPAPSPAREASTRGCPAVFIPLLVGGLLMTCLAVAAGGALMWWRGQREQPAVPVIVSSTDIADPTATPDSAEPDSVVSTPQPTQPSDPAITSLQTLVGEWEIVEGDETDVGERFRLQLELDGLLRVRMVDEYVDIEGIEDVERTYLELDADGQGRWSGSAVFTEWVMETDELIEIGREPIVIILLSDGQEVLIGPPESEGFIARRVSGP